MVDGMKSHHRESVYPKDAYPDGFPGDERVVIHEGEQLHVTVWSGFGPQLFIDNPVLVLFKMFLKLTTFFFTEVKVWRSQFTRPTKKRTATFPDLIASYCIHDLRTAILRLKLFAVETTPTNIVNGWWKVNGADISIRRSVTCSESSDVGSPPARRAIGSKSPEIRTWLTIQGSKLCFDVNRKSQLSLLSDSNCRGWCAYLAICEGGDVLPVDGHLDSFPSHS